MCKLGVLHRSITSAPSHSADAMAHFGSATVHEATGRAGPLRSGVRPGDIIVAAVTSRCRHHHFDDLLYID